METVWICTVPKEAGESSTECLSSIKRATSHSAKLCEFFPLEIPELHHGTLDSLIALSDELHKLGPSVENMVKKVERQYFEIQETAGKKTQPLKVQEKSVDWARRIEKPTRRRKKVLNTIHVDEELQDMEWDMGSDGEVELP